MGEIASEYPGHLAVQIVAAEPNITRCGATQSVTVGDQNIAAEPNECICRLVAHEHARPVIEQNGVVRGCAIVGVRQADPHTTVARHQVFGNQDATRPINADSCGHAAGDQITDDYNALTILVDHDAHVGGARHKVVDDPHIGCPCRDPDGLRPGECRQMVARHKAAVRR